MKSKIQTSFLLCLLVLIFGCIPPKSRKPSPYPECIENCKVPKRFQSPRQGYFIGVSKLYPEEQDAKNNAIFDARKQIVTSLKVDVYYTFSEKFQMQETGQEISFVDVSTAILTEIVSKNILIGSKILEIRTERWVENMDSKYKVRVRMAFSEKQQKDFWNRLIRETLKYAKEFMDKAQDQEKKVNIKKALSYYCAVIQMSDKLNTIAPTGEAIAFKQEVENVASEAKIIIQNIPYDIKLEKLSRDIRVDEHIGKLKKPVRFKATYKGIPLVNFPISFKFEKGNGSPNEKIVSTNENGIASFTVTRYEIAEGEKEAEISVKPDIGEVCVRFSEHSQETFVISVIANRVAVRILNSSGVEQKVEQVLRQKKYKVIVNKPPVRSVNDLMEGNTETINNIGKQTGADFIAVGNIKGQPKPFKANEKSEHTFWTATLTLQIKIMDVEQGGMKFSGVISRKSNPKNNREEAHREAVREIIKAIPGLMRGLKQFK